MNLTSLSAYVDSLVTWLQNSARTAVHNTASVQRLSAGQLSKIPSPGAGIFLTAPMDTVAHHNDGGVEAYDWTITIVINSAKCNTKQDAWIDCFTRLQTMNNLITQRWNWNSGIDWSELCKTPAKPSVYDETDQQIIAGLHYVIAVPL